MNLTLPPPLSVLSPINPCICPVDTTISCVKWSSNEWLITASLLSTFLGVVITVSTLYINKLKKDRPRMVTNLSTINENDSIPEIMVIQR
jgi:hypothetical protein